jgi:ABC-type multidrug transport system ATPase subunit
VGLVILRIFLSLTIGVGGETVPDSGNIEIQGTSVVRHPKNARASLGVCPQFTAIDSHLTVKQHLVIYGRLKGLRTGSELEENITTVLQATKLAQYADRLASKLSGGNQRKLALAIALLGRLRIFHHIREDSLRCGFR